MATSLNKVITRNADNTINTSTNYSELNVKASNLTNNLVTHLEAQITTMEGAMQAKEGAVDVKIASLASVGTSTYTTPYLDRSLTMLSKAEFNAVAAERRANRAGSGFDEFGKHYSVVATYPNVNEGIWTASGYVNLFNIGAATSTAGTSKTDYPIASINGINHVLNKINKNDSTQLNNIFIPPAPTVLPSTATLTQQQIDSGVIKHADASNSGLIVNGKFDTDTSGWTLLGIGTAIVSNGTVELTSTTSSTGLQQSFQTIIGKQYFVEANITTSTVYLGVASTSDGAFLNTPTTVTSNGRSTFTFTATATTTYLIVKDAFSVAGTTIIDNIAVLPADAISRSDLVFLESWHEDVSEKGVVYRYGNVQFKGASESAFGTQVTPSAGTPVFAGYGTYSLFSDTWQADEALIGNCYRWDPLYMTDAQRKAFVADPENNCYLDGDKVIQVRYRMRVVQGLGDSWFNPFTTNAYSSSNDQVLMYTQNVLSTFVSIKGKVVSIPNDYSSSYSTSLRTTRTEDNSIGAYISDSDSLTYSYNLRVRAIPIALVHRRNTGMKHDTYNPNGTKLASDSLPWYSTTVSFTSIADCFTDSKLLTASGYIGTTTGRADGIFYDQVHEGDITDLRVNSRGMNDYTRTMDKWFAKLQDGTYRGTEGEWNIVKYGAITYDTGATNTTVWGTINTFIQDNSNTLGGTSYGVSTTISDDINIFIKSNTKWYLAKQLFSGTDSYIRILGNVLSDFTVSNSYDFVVATKSTRTKSNTITHTDIIGSPANYPTAWKQSGVSGVPLIVAEDGTSLLPTGTTGSDGLATFKLSRDANATPLQVLKSTDSGVTWTALTVTTHYTFSTTTNAITFTAGNIPLTTDLVRVTYQTHTNMAVAAVNSEVLAIGDVFATSASGSNAGGFLHQSLTGKCGVYASSLINYQTIKLDGYSIKVWYNNVLSSDSNTSPTTHGQITLTSNSNPAVKVLPYLTRSNGKAYLSLVFKEMKYGSYAAPTVMTAASATYTINMTYKINIAGCALDGKVIQWTASTATSAIDWSLYDVSPTGVIYLLSSGAVYANARLYDGDSWGDDYKFNIVDNVSTTTDTNGATVLIGQKRVELNYFIGASE